MCGLKVFKSDPEMAREVVVVAGCVGEWCGVSNKETSLKRTARIGMWCRARTEHITGAALIGAFFAVWLSTMTFGYAYCEKATGVANFICAHVEGLAIAAMVGLICFAWLMAWIFGRTDSATAAAAFVLSSLIAVFVWLWMTPLDAIGWFIDRFDRRR